MGVQKRSRMIVFSDNKVNKVSLQQDDLRSTLWGHTVKSFELERKMFQNSR